MVPVDLEVLNYTFIKPRWFPQTSVRFGAISLKMALFPVSYFQFHNSDSVKPLHQIEIESSVFLPLAVKFEVRTGSLVGGRQELRPVALHMLESSILQLAIAVSCGVMRIGERTKERTVAFKLAYARHCANK
jgi:hypothetical protein